MIGKIHMQNFQKSAQFHMALSQWDTEGGAGPCGSQEGSRTLPLQSDVTPLTDSEIVQLRIRVIALENLIIAVLAEGTDHQRSLAGEIADLISPRQGSTPHPLTIKAASHMVDLLQRSQHFQDQGRHEL
jgi:hypothetical protein